MSEIKNDMPSTEGEARYVKAKYKIIWYEAMMRYYTNQSNKKTRLYAWLVLNSDHGYVDNPRNTKSELMKKLDIGTRVYDNYIAQLKRKGLIKLSSEGELKMVGFEGVNTRIKYNKLILYTE